MLRALRWAFSTSGQALVYLACAAGVLTAMSLAGWGTVDGSRWAMLTSLLVASPYLIGLFAVQLRSISRDVALTLLFAVSLASGVVGWMFSFTVFGLVFWAVTPVLFMGTLLIALGDISLHRGWPDA